MGSGDRLDTYHFYEQDWNSYAELRDWFEWEVPESFNMTEYVCERWAAADAGPAIYYENAADEEATYTFSELNAVTDSLASYLANQGIERGDRIGINIPQKPETAIAHIAAWKLGAVTVPLSILYGPDGISYRLGDSSAKAIVVDHVNVDSVRDVYNDLDALSVVLTVDVDDPADDETGLDTAIEAGVGGFESVDTAAEDDAVILYTSGTTGPPKGVRHAHRLLLGFLPMTVTAMANMDLPEDAVFWGPSEWSWIATLYVSVLPPLFYGKPIVAYQGEQFDPETAFELIDRYRVTNYFCPPSGLRLMQQSEVPAGLDVSCLQTIGSGGESLSEAIANWTEETFSGATINEIYGQTEADPIIAECGALLESREGKMGKALPGVEVVMLNPETTEPTVDHGDVGEIGVRYEGSLVCFKEYWNKPEKTAEKVQNGWLLTEDLAIRDADGYFEFKGRTDDVIISSGYRIGPDEVEDSLLSHEAVAEAGVIGVPDEDRGEIIKAYVVLDSGYEPTPELTEDLQNYVRNNLAKYQYPREIEYLEEMPKTVTGKVRRTSLREREGIK